MGIAAVRSWFKGNRKGSRKSISRPYRRLFLEELEDRSLLSASFTASTLAIIDGREFLLPSERLGNAYRIIGTVGNYEEFTVGLGAPISITGLATADGTIVYEVVNETSGRPSWPRLMAGHAQSLLSGALTSTTLSAPFISAGIGKMATTLPVNLASIALSANQGFAADSANSEFNTRSLPFMPLSMTKVNGTLFIQGEENGAVELWRSDGTADGTILLNSFAPTFYYEMLNRGEHAVVNGTFFFTADDGHGLELWKSDGTPNGTVMVKDINPGGESGSFSVMANVNGTLFFSAFDGVSNS